MEEKIILWGAGRNSRNLLRKYFMPLDQIEEVVDSDERLWDSDFCGHPIKSPQILKNKGLKSRLVVIGTDRYFEEVRSQLEEMGAGMESILINDYVNGFPSKKEETTAGYFAKEEVEQLLERLCVVGGIPQRQLKNAIVLANREEAIKRLPKGGIVAEVGVAYGDFTDVILKEMRPTHFYAIDWFNKDNPYICMWGRRELVDSGLTHENWYRKKYRKEVADGRMTVCSGMSWDCLSEFEDEFFDFIYLDACHDFESITQDTTIAARKIKDGGVILFDDYTLWSIEEGMCYGVVPAVHKLLSERKEAEVLYFCMSLYGYCDIAIRVNKGE